jgi:hypothetical protein
MLKEVYLNVGMGGTLLIGTLFMLTAMTWFVAVAGVVVRPMTRGRRVAMLSLLTVLPPSSLLVLYRFVSTAAEFPRPGMGKSRR